jgi:P2 family phage contractile tail tube protein
MAARNIIRNMTVSVDGRGYAGDVTEFTTPNLTLSTEEHRAGGMDAPVTLDMGMEAIEASFQLTNYDASLLTQFGLREGNQVPLVGRGVMESYDGTVRPVVVTMRGKITGLDRGSWSPGSVASMTVTMRADYYREEHDGTTIFEIDIVNMIRVINGEDQLASYREALGV